MSRLTSDTAFASAPLLAERTRNGCPACAGPVDMFSPHIVVDGSTVKVFCSARCRTGPEVDGWVEKPSPPKGRSRLRPFVAGGAFLGILFVAESTSPEPSVAAAPAPRPIVTVAVPAPEPPAVTAEAEWVKEILRDVWLHPLAGPMRRMPSLDGAVFGAERPGERPPECKNGHCGVDIGGDVWGEPVLAVHDGVVDRVQRGPNDEHGGLYVRLSHRNGTVFTQYFHLAAIPRWIRVGRPVEAGEVIGLLGDTGVKESGPHLHFTISVKPSPDRPEEFIDPEPLIALWPLHLRARGTDGRSLSTGAAVGQVHGAARLRKRAAARDVPDAEKTDGDAP